MRVLIPRPAPIRKLSWGYARWFWSSFEVAGRDQNPYYTLAPVGQEVSGSQSVGAKDWLDCVIKAAGFLYGTRPQLIHGQGEFVGTRLGDDHPDPEQRADARRDYERIIAEAAVAPELQGHDIEAAWDDARYYWLSQILEAVGRNSATMRAKKRNTLAPNGLERAMVREPAVR